MKNKDTHYLAFGKSWFEKNQKILLWFLNTPIVKNIFRRIMRIREKDKISDITPNYYTVYLGTFLDLKKRKLIKKYSRRYYTRNILSERIYHSFKPIWWLMHYWDMAIANKYNPAWNLGFDVLEFIPADGANSPCDGVVYRNLANGSGEDWATIKAGAGNSPTATQTTAKVSWTTDNDGDGWIKLYRAFLNFNLAATMPADATVSDTSLELVTAGKADPGSNTPQINVFEATPAGTNTLVSGDFDNVGTTPYATAIAYADWPASGNVATFTFNATGVAAVQAAITGVLSISLREATYDAGSSTPSYHGTSEETQFTFHTAETSTAGYEPTLVVTYSTVSLPTVTTQAFS